MSDGYYSCKKTDDICEDVCGQVSPNLRSNLLIDFVLNRFLVSGTNLIRLELVVMRL